MQAKSSIFFDDTGSLESTEGVLNHNLSQRKKSSASDVAIRK